MKTTLTKKIIRFFFLLNFYSVSAQANLQFNQVKLIGVTTETVPIGKVWKIESILYSQTISALSSSSTGQAANDADILVNGNNLIVRSARQNIGGGSGVSLGLIWEINYPFWIPAGSTLSAGQGVSFISIIEFNLIP